jgi:hypothetical protein
MGVREFRANARPTRSAAPIAPDLHFQDPAQATRLSGRGSWCPQWILRTLRLLGSPMAATAAGVSRSSLSKRGHFETLEEVGEAAFNGQLIASHQK